jgi:RNA ligase (TIGR02306 family)
MGFFVDFVQTPWYIWGVIEKVNMTIERKLATVVKIVDIQPIIGADAIVVASVKGWKVVVKKGEFNVGDLAVYYEIDSFLPIRPQFEFLRKSSYKRMISSEGFRLKTIKLRGQLSQGLLTPIPEGIVDPKEGDDLTEALDIVKYEPPIPAQLAGKIKGTFPNFIPKTDEIRIQNFESEVGFSPVGERAYVTEKLDGTSFTCYFNNGVFGVCGRNWELTETSDNSLWRMANLLQLKEKMTKHGKNIALQGELIGAGINGNLYGLSDHKLYFFTGYDIDKGRRMFFDELEWVLFGLQLQMVPVLEKYGFVIPNESNIVDYMLRYAEGKSVLNMEVDREGVVVRGLEREFSFKAISNTYLLGSKD